MIRAGKPRTPAARAICSTSVHQRSRRLVRHVAPCRRSDRAGTLRQDGPSTPSGLEGRAALVLRRPGIDAVSAWSPGEDRRVNQKVMDLALQRILDLGGVTVTRRADGDADVDVSPVVDAATVLTFYFCDLVALLSQQERETIVNVDRWALDTHEEPDN